MLMAPKARGGMPEHRFVLAGALVQCTVASTVHTFAERELAQNARCAH